MHVAAGWNVMGPGAVMVLIVSWHCVVAFTVTVDSSRFLLQ